MHISLNCNANELETSLKRMKYELQLQTRAKCANEHANNNFNSAERMFTLKHSSKMRISIANREVIDIVSIFILIVDFDSTP